MMISIPRAGRWSVLWLWTFASIALAGEENIPKLLQLVTFHIEKGPLESSLIQFSRQAEVQIVLAPDSAANVVAPAVSGRLQVDAALTALLKGTGLVYTAVGNTVTVQKK